MEHDAVEAVRFGDDDDVTDDDEDHYSYDEDYDDGCEDYSQEDFERNFRDDSDGALLEPSHFDFNEASGSNNLTQNIDDCNYNSDNQEDNDVISLTRTIHVDDDSSSNRESDFDEVNQAQGLARMNEDVIIRIESSSDDSDNAEQESSEACMGDSYDSTEIEKLKLQLASLR